jgi:hypothetical protein
VFFQLAPYADRERPAISFDTPYYVWRTRLVAARGVGPLTTLPDAVTPNPDRPGFPVLGSVVGAVTGTDAFTFAIAIRAMAAVAIGLAAGAMAVTALGHPPWALAIFVLALGTSAAVTGTAIGSLENMVADVPLMALAGVVPLALHGRRSLGAIFLLFTGAALIHWVFATLFLVLTLVVAAASRLLARDRAVRAGGPVGTGRVWRLVGVTVAAIAGAALLLPALPHGLPPTTGQKGNLLRLAIYELPFLLPVAALGAVLSFRKATSTARTTVVLLSLWAASVPAAILVSWALPIPLKIFRVAAFALGVPALVAAGLVALVRIGRERLGVIGAAAGVGLTLLLLAIAMPAETGPFNDRAGAHLAQRLDQARAAGRYLGSTGDGRAVVFVVGGRVGVFDRVVRSAVPARMIEDTHVYVGALDALLRGMPTSDPSRPKLSAESAAWWKRAWRDPASVLRRDPIVIGIESSPGADDGGIRLGPGLRILRGPPPAAAFSPPGPIHLSWPRLLVTVAATLAVVCAAGYGWTRSLLDVGSATALGFAPALGIAVLVILGAAAARFGSSLGSGVGIAVVSMGVVAGWLPLLARRRAGSISPIEGGE